MRLEQEEAFRLEQERQLEEERLERERLEAERLEQVFAYVACTNPIKERREEEARIQREEEERIRKEEEERLQRVRIYSFFIFLRKKKVDVQKNQQLLKEMLFMEKMYPVKLS